MGWSHLVYLLSGVGLGASSSRIFRAIRNHSRGAQHPNSSVAVSKRKTQNNLKACREQLEHTQLAYQMASENSKFQGGFLARVSHELRSPLNSIIGMHQIILEDLCDNPAEERECIANAHEAALRLINMIDEFILVSKTEHGIEKQEIEPIKLADIFQEVRRLTKQQAANRNLELQIVMPHSEVYVLADRRRFKQVLVNLVDSAITPETQGSIKLSSHLDAQQECVRIVLEDRRPARYWSDPIDLLTSLGENEDRLGDRPTPGLTLMANKILLELMEGSLEVLAVPSATDSDLLEATSNLSRIQCTIPLATLEL